MSGTNDIFTSTLSTYLSSTTPLPETLQRLTHPLASKFQTPDTSPDDIHFEALWTAILRAAASAPPPPSPNDPSPHHAALLSLLKAIAALGPLSRASDGKHATHWDGTAWTDLPAFGAAARDLWNEAPGSGAHALSAEQWASVNAFAALVTADKDLGGAKASCDFALFGLWALRAALEEKQPRPEDVLPAAVAWLENAGPTLLALSDEQKVYVQEGQSPDPARVGALAKETIGKGGFSSERWAFWRQQLLELSEQRDAAGGREKVAKLAYHGVEKIDAAKA